MLLLITKIAEITGITKISGLQRVDYQNYRDDMSYVDYTRV